ncbi:MAG: MarR family transcriptional regulator [Rhodospirillales bacterium]|nr:MarR family transcriptional regulator [Rhodospirillales bacterium]
MKPRPARKGDATNSARPKNTFDMGMLEDLFGYHLRRAQAAVFEDFMRTMTESRLTPGQFGVLILIDRNKGLSQSALARALGIERSTMVAVINGLEDRNLVERHPSATDGRSYALSLSPLGNRLLADTKPRVRRHEKRLTAGLKPGEVETLTDLLKRISETARS